MMADMKKARQDRTPAPATGSVHEAPAHRFLKELSMKPRHTIYAILFLAGTAALAAAAVTYGIEVIGQSGSTTVVQTTNAPDGSSVEAVITLDGQDTLVDTCPVDPVSGQATVYFPQAGTDHRVLLRGPSGTVLAQTGGYLEGIECD